MELRNPERVASGLASQSISQLLQSCEESFEHFLNPGLQQPWAGISERFQRYYSEAFLDPGLQQRSHPVARTGTPAWAEVSQRFQRYYSEARARLF
jgi:hypothetical protein